MPRIVFTEAAIQGLERCQLFLLEKNLLASLRAAQAIKRAFTLLQTEPEIGRPLNELPEWRKLIIHFGESGYVALYRYEPIPEVLYVLAFRHQKETGY